MTGHPIAQKTARTDLSTPSRRTIGLSHLYKGAIDLYPLNPEVDGMRIDQQITRQQLGTITGISDDVLAFWIKNGLLVATSGGEGRGSHRRFDGFQANIAAILAEMRNFGINLAGLRSFATRLQAATSLGKSAECNPWAFNDAGELFEKLERFSLGEDVDVVLEFESTTKAKSVEEIHLHYQKWPSHLYDTFDNISVFAERITRDDLPLLDLFMAIHAEGYRHVYRGTQMYYGDSSWLAVRVENDDWRIFNGPAGTEPLPSGADYEEISSGIYLLPGTITRRVWKGRLSPILIEEIPPSEEEQAIMDRARELSAERERVHNVRAALRILAAENRK